MPFVCYGTKHAINFGIIYKPLEDLLNGGDCKSVHWKKKKNMCQIAQYCILFLETQWVRNYFHHTSEHIPFMHWLYLNKHLKAELNKETHFYSLASKLEMKEGGNQFCIM